MLGNAINAPVSAIRRVVLDARGYVWIRVMQGGPALVASIALSHALDPSEYGKFAVALAIGTVSGTILFNWVSSSVFRFYSDAKGNGELPSLFAATVWAMILSSAMGVLLLAGIEAAIYAFHVGWSASLPSLILGLAIADAVLTIYKSVLMARCNIGRLSVLVTIESALRWGGALAALLLSRTATALLLGQLAGLTVLCAAIGLSASRHAVQAAVGEWPRAQLRRMFAFGAPLAGSSISAWVTSVADRVMLAGMLGAAQAGIYAAGYQIASNAVLLPASILMAGTYPILIQEYRDGGRRAAAAMLTTLTSAALIGGIAIVIAVATGANLMVSILGRSYRGSAGVLAVVAAAQLAAVITEYYAKSFQLTNETARLFVISLASAVVTVIGNLFLIPRIGMYGSAVTTLLATVTGLVLTIVWGRPLLEFQLRPGLTTKLTAASLVSTVAAIALRAVDASPVIALVPVLCFAAAWIALKENTTLAALRLCIGRSYR